MTLFTSSQPPISVPDIDIYNFLFQPNIYNTVRRHDQPLLIDGLSGKSISFQEAQTLSSQLARGWKENVGLTKGDVVAVFAPNQYDHAVLYLSLLAAQCTITPGNPNYTEAEFNYQIQKTKAKALVTVPSLLPILCKVAANNGIPPERIYLFGEEAVGSIQPLKSLAARHRNKPLLFPPKGDINPAEDTAFICFSSGTTGIAKGVMLTHRNFVSQMILVSSYEEINPHEAADVYIGFLPFYHIFGLTTLVLRAFYTNTQVVVVPKYELELVCRLIEKYKATVCALVPPVAVHLAKNEAVLKYDLSSLKMITSGAAPLSSEHIEALNLRVKAPVRQGYGLTETTAGCIYQKVGVSLSGSSGVLLANMECKIVDVETGNEVGPDQPGEILLKGPVIMKGYLDDVDANNKTFTDDGFLRTGDVAIFNSKSKEFYIIDRIKELIKYKGFQVAPAELEALIMSHESIADCCVVGVYDATQATELPRAYIVPQPSVPRNNDTIRIITDFVNSNVANHKKLRGGVRIIDQVPKSASGKILRREVKEWIRKEQISANRARL
ncbi:hypothetical protein BDF20DRAFT_823555 [Mycotypha africana]|uniref:uncharacterized protein n=1 Tax=Mycotypha africana TaxID=64632 RepID=UPI002301D0A2|nr:uncharacterized protein BDF20DRAFT_823555 [Mycotypha africana]KAI8973357.1 hypothetical protein BDF20DRAFT_823555 [Mycotypha africana]